MNLVRNKKKLLFFCILIFSIFAFIYSLYSTYAINNDDAVVFSMPNDGEITLNPGSSKFLLYQVNNENEGTLQYGLVYNNINNIKIKYIYEKGDLPLGIIKKSETKSILLEITNMNNSSSSSFNLKTIYGYEKGGDLNVLVPSGYSLINDAIGNFLIRYDANGGDGLVNSSQSVASTQTNLISDILTKKGYDFLGWSTNKDSTSAQYSAGQNIIVNCDMTLYAIWKAKSFTVTYDANGGTGAPSNQIGVFDSTFTFSNIIPSNPGYKFYDWVDSSGEHWSTGYASKNGLWIWDNGNYGVKDNILNLKAVWIADSVKANDFTFNGVKEFIKDGGKNWRYKFYSNGTFTPVKNILVDIFLVGGGGAGEKGFSSADVSWYGGGSGGGGGYVKTLKNVFLSANVNYEIIIGEGGKSFCSSGEETSICLNGNYLTGTNLSGESDTANASGGEGGSQEGSGGSGGSGGGCGSYDNPNHKVVAGNGGSNGSSGDYHTSSSGNKTRWGGSGQGNTTEFGESNGSLYAGGGGGGGGNSSGYGGSGGGGDGASTGSPSSGEPNTGGGGGGCGRNCTVVGEGGSGIIVIRNAQ